MLGWSCNNTFFNLFNKLVSKVFYMRVVMVNKLQNLDNWHHPNANRNFICKFVFNKHIL